MTKRKNGKIEFVRFLFTMFVVLYHCQRHYLKGKVYWGHFSFFAKGYIGVEFFFLVTGFLMAKSVYKHVTMKHQNSDRSTQNVSPAMDLGRETAAFVWKKMKAILPYHFSAFGIIIFVTAVYKQQSIKQLVKTVFDSVPGLLLFSKTGFNFGNLNRVEWYIICMMFALMILYPICRKYFSMYVYVIAPVGSMFLLGYLMQNYGSLAGGGASSWNGVIFTCMIRALAEISLGATCFELSRRLGEASVTKGQKLLLTVLENGCYLFSFLFVVSTLDSKYEIYALLALVAAIAFTFSGVTYGNQVFDNKVCYFLGANSLVIYLSQVLPLDMVKYLFAGYTGYTRTLFMVLLTFTNAILCKLIVKVFVKIVKKNPVQKQ